VINKNGKILFENGEYGLRAEIRSQWNEGLLRELLDANISELELNLGKGWRGRDIGFVKELSSLRAFTIHDFTINSVEPIHALNALEKLEVHTYCETPIRFECFPKLSSCGIEWRKGSQSLFNVVKLQELFVNRYDGSKSEVFSSLVNLEKLTILNAIFPGIQGFQTLVKLRSLRLGNLIHLSSLSGIQDLIRLEELIIDLCVRIMEIPEISHLYNLRRLMLANLGAIKSLSPINFIENLEEVLFSGTTNILDGNLAPLKNLRNLKKTSFQNRRHYSHRREEFGIAYFGATDGQN
jgi:hypothetical protein